MHSACSCTLLCSCKAKSVIRGVSNSFLRNVFRLLVQIDLQFCDVAVLHFCDTENKVGGFFTAPFGISDTSRSKLVFILFVLRTHCIPVVLCRILRRIIYCNFRKNSGLP